MTAPVPEDSSELDQAILRTGSAAMAASGPDRDGLIQCTEALAAVRDIAELWGAGIPPGATGIFCLPGGGPL